MRPATIVLVAAVLGCLTPRSTDAQQLRGFGTFIVSADLNNQLFPGAAGGILVDLADSWISVGAEADLLVSFPYFAGRGGPFAQFNVLRRGAVRAFAMGGMAWGEEAGPMIGAGVEFWTRGRIGFRATVQDYLAQVAGMDCADFGYDGAYCEAALHGGRAYTAHRTTVQFGIVWR